MVRHPSDPLAQGAQGVVYKPEFSDPPTTYSISGADSLYGNKNTGKEEG